MKVAIKEILSLLLALAIVFGLVAFGAYKESITVIKANSAELVIHFIDVGQADACVIELPDGKNMLIDAGEKSSSDEIITYLQSSTGVTESSSTVQYSFDYCIMTHSDADHIGGMSDVLDSYPSKVVYRPNQAATDNDYADPAYNGTGDGKFWGTDDIKTKSSEVYYSAISAAYATAETVIVTNPLSSTQWKISGDGYTFDFYSPLSSGYDDSNDYSPIMVLSYGGRNIVFSGDAESENEEEFVNHIKNGNDDRYDNVFTDSFNADIIKLGHHGSETSSSEDYLNIMTSDSKRAGTHVVISCGRNVSYGHPHIGTLQRLMDMNFCADRVLRTDKNGDIVFKIAQNGKITQSTEKSATVTEIMTSGEYRNDTRPTTTAELNNVTAPTGFDDALTSGGDEGGGETYDEGGTDAPQGNVLTNIFDAMGLDHTLGYVLFVIAAVIVVIILILMFAAMIKSSKHRRQAISATRRATRRAVRKNYRRRK